MKRILLICSLLIATVTASDAATNVSGGIYANTTWTTAGSPYIINGTVTIFTGDTLIIQPGVVVKFRNNAAIQVGGSLYAHGTTSDSIVFTSDSISPKAGVYQGISNGTSFSYCSFYYANNALSSGGYYNIVSHCSFYGCLFGINSGNFIVDSCNFRHDSTGIYQLQQPVVSSDFVYDGDGIQQGEAGVYNCSFLHNGYGIRALDGPAGGVYNCIVDSNRIQGLSLGDDTVKNCTINYNALGITNEDGVTEFCSISNNTIGLNIFSNDKYSCNSICNNTTYNAEDYSGGDVSMENNYWCLPDSTSIQSTLNDGYNNSSLGLIIFTPFNTAPCTSTSCSLYAFASTNNQYLAPCGTATLSAVISDNTGTITSETWNPGGLSGSSVTVSPSETNTYTLTVTDNNGCSNSSTITIVTGAPATPSICYVTADTASQRNLVVWSKAGIDTLSVDSVLIYREVSTNVYDQIGSASIHGYTEFTDPTSKPYHESYFYEIGVKSNCTTSAQSSPMETVFLQSAAGLGNVVNLSWNFYGGNTVNNYVILRDDSGLGNWHIIDSVSGNVGAYTDYYAPTSPNLRYVLNTSWSLGCTPYIPAMVQKVTGNHNNKHYVFNSNNGAYSNITNVVITGIAPILTLSDFDVYPNPASTEVSISLHQTVDGIITLTNVLGQDVYNAAISGNRGTIQKVDISNLQQGVYFLKITSNGQVLTKKVLKI